MIQYLVMDFRRRISSLINLTHNEQDRGTVIVIFLIIFNIEEGSD